jgi:ABC-2 type transport system permease protein
VIGYARTIIATESQRYVLEASAIAPAGPPVVASSRASGTTRSCAARSSSCPGLLAYIAMITAVVSTALSVVREKERGTMEQVRMAPIGALPFIVGKSVPYLFVSLVSGLGVMLAAMALFDLPMRGSWPAFLVALSLFLAARSAWGLLISTIAQTQQVAFQAALLSSFLPTMLLSGFIFPIASMPIALQVITYAVPARYFLTALRGIVLKGAGLASVADSLGALVLFTAVVLGVAAVRLRREWA